MNKAFIYASINSLTMFILAQAAHAVPIVFGELPGEQRSTFFGGRVDTFDAPDGGCQVSADTPGGIVTRDTVRGVRINPTGSCYVALPRRGEATFSYAQPFQAFGFFWGSVDSFNTVTFRRNGSFIFAINGTQAVQALRREEGFINFIFANPAEAFDEVVFFSSAPAFEFDNVSVGLPTSHPVAEGPPPYPYPYPFDPGIPFPPRPVGLGFTPINVSFDEGDSLNVTTQAVSEPASLALFGVGLLGLGLVTGRRRLS